MYTNKSFESNEEDGPAHYSLEIGTTFFACRLNCANKLFRSILRYFCGRPSQNHITKHFKSKFSDSFVLILFFKDKCTLFLA